MSKEEKVFIENAEAVIAVAGDLRRCCEQSKKSSTQVNELLTEIRARIEREQKENASSLTAARKAAVDRSRTETARMMAELEVQRLEEWEPELLPAETKLFNETLSKGYKAVKDWRDTNRMLKKLLSEMEQLLLELKPGVLTRGLDPDQYETILRTASGKFDALSQSLDKE